MGYWERIPPGENDRDESLRQPYEKIVDQNVYDTAARQVLDQIVAEETAFDEEGYWRNHHHVEPDPLPAAVREPRAARKKTRRRWIPIAMVSVVVVLIALLLVAQPWKPAAVDSYSPSEPIRYQQPVTLAVGESFEVEVDLGENEQIAAVTTTDGDILGIDGTVATALGEWQGAMLSVSTEEIAVPGKEPVPFTPFGWDLTAPYNRLRDSLRNLLGVEKFSEQRTDRRKLNVYEIIVHVEGHPIEVSTVPINLYTEDVFNLSIPNLMENEEVFFESDRDIVQLEIADIAQNPRVFVIKTTGTTGQQVLTATVGFFKEEAFVPTRAYVYHIEVKNRAVANEEGTAEPVVFTNGSYNGLIPVIEPESGEKPNSD